MNLATPIGTGHYLALSLAIFAIGVAGALSRRNIFVVLMSLELMLNAANLAFVTFARLHNDAVGQIAVLFVIAIAAGEVSVGLSIVIALFRLKESVDLDRYNNLRE